MVYKINVEGMSCGHCQKAVTKMISEIDNVSNVAVSLEEETASFDTEEANLNLVIETVNKSDFKASI